MRENCGSVSYEEALLHVLVLVVPRHLSEAPHSFPITVLVNHTYFILERKKKPKKKNNTTRTSDPVGSLPGYSVLG